MAQELIFIIRTLENWPDDAVQEVAAEFTRRYDGNLAVESAYLAEVREIVPQAWDCDHCGEHIETPGDYGPDHNEQCDLHAPVHHCNDECDAPINHGGPCPGYEPPEAYADGYSIAYYGTEEIDLSALTELELGQYYRGAAAGVARLTRENGDTIDAMLAGLAALDRNKPDHDAKAIVLALTGMALEARGHNPLSRYLVLTDSDQGPYAVWAATTDADGNELTEYEPDDNCWASLLYDPARQAAAPYVKDGTEVGPKRAPWEGVEIDIDKLLTHRQETT